MSRFHDQTSAWFTQGEDAEVLNATPGGEPEPRRPVGRIVATSAITLGVALLAVFLIHRSSRAASQNKSPATSLATTAPALAPAPASTTTPAFATAPASMTAPAS
ncbi:MAG TPA: hypothetical protein VFF06_09850, partial [Polyangia bacterium]|nr:hypothetical protein [Polyangia bacterium]